MNNPIELIVMGASAGGLNTLTHIFQNLDDSFPVPVLVTKHVGNQGEQGMKAFISRYSQMPVQLAMDKQPIETGRVYLAPADYHMQIEKKGIISLSSDERVCHVRPAIDVLFESAATAYGSSLLAVLLSGANRDGVAGIRMVRQKGGVTVAQDPETAEVAIMPEAAIQSGCVDYVVGLNKLPEFFRTLFLKRS